MRLKVRELLYMELGRSLEDVAARLHMSSRTLIRKLRQEGLSFQGIKDDLRRDLAILQLARGEVALGEIAYALGFSSVAVFHRAFRHWTGMTPGAYRAATVRNQDGWYRAFDVQPGQALFLAPEQRVRIW